MNKLKKLFEKIDPEIVIVATGIGAGDMITASFAGVKFGTVIIWSIILCGFFWI